MEVILEQVGKGRKLVHNTPLGYICYTYALAL
jgi:hypothetical protein